MLFSHGIPGAALFVWWFLYQFWRFRASAPPVTFWCHVLILMALVQLPFYGWLPAPLIVITMGIALAARELFADGQRLPAVKATDTGSADHRALAR